MGLISTSDCFIHPYKTYKQRLSHCYAVSRVCTLIPLHLPSWPQIWGLRVTCRAKKSCHNLTVEADIHLRPLQTSILHIYKVFQPFVCCLKGIWVHPYTITSAKLAPDLGNQGYLRNENDGIITWLRLISTSDCFIHPYKTYTKCLSH